LRRDHPADRRGRLRPNTALGTRGREADAGAARTIGALALVLFAVTFAIETPVTSRAC
jgi:hypothetical protein